MKPKDAIIGGLAWAIATTIEGNYFYGDFL
jgi:hypothetical protein